MTDSDKYCIFSHRLNESRCEFVVCVCERVKHESNKWTETRKRSLKRERTKGRIMESVGPDSKRDDLGEGRRLVNQRWDVKEGRVRMEYDTTYRDAALKHVVFMLT